MSTSRFFKQNLPVYYQVFSAFQAEPVDFIGKKKNCDKLADQDKVFLSCVNEEAGFVYFPSDEYDSEVTVEVESPADISQLELRLVVPSLKVSRRTHRMRLSFNKERREVSFFENRGKVSIDLPKGDGEVQYSFVLGDSEEHVSPKDIIVHQGVVTLNPNAVTPLPFVIVDDATYEKDETLTLVLEPSGGNSFSNNKNITQILIKVIDDEEPPFLQHSQWIVSESDGEVLLPINLSWPTEIGSQVTIEYAGLSHHTATKDVDYLFQNRTLVFRNDQEVTQFHIPFLVFR